MNVSLALLHGEQVFFSLIFAALIALVGVPIVLYVWLWHTKVSELQLSIAYLIFMAILAAVFGANPSAARSMLPLTASSLGFILTLPWNVLIGLVLSKVLNFDWDDSELAILMLLGAGVNAVLLYLIALKLRRLIR
jgi:hypothetical protein